MAHDVDGSGLNLLLNQLKAQVRIESNGLCAKLDSEYSVVSRFLAGQTSARIINKLS